MHSDTSTASAKGHLSWNQASRPPMTTQKASDTALCISPSQVKGGIYKGNVCKPGRIHPVITCTNTLLLPLSLHVRPMADASCIFEYVCSKLTKNGIKVRRPPTFPRPPPPSLPTPGCFPCDSQRHALSVAVALNWQRVAHSGRLADRAVALALFN